MNKLEDTIHKGWAKLNDVQNGWENRVVVINVSYVKKPTYKTHNIHSSKHLNLFNHERGICKVNFNSISLSKEMK